MDTPDWYQRVVEDAVEKIRQHVTQTSPDDASRMVLYRSYLWWLPKELALAWHDPEALLANMAN
jgi:hypothetical protein